MRVLIHAPAARMGGARSHLMGLVPELAAIGTDDQFLLLAQPELIEALGPLPGNWETRAERAQDRGFVGRLIWEQRALPRLAAEWRADVLLSFGSFVPVRSPCPTVLEAGNALQFTRAYWLWVNQQPLRLQLEEQARWMLLRASLKSAARVLVPTRAMRQDVAAAMPELAGRLDVVWWGVADHFREEQWSDPSGDEQRVVGVSKHGVNKEFDVLVRAVERLSMRWPKIKLEMTGTVDESRWSRETALLAERLKVSDRVHFVGDVPNPKVPDLLKDASMLVFPTWCESFGLPLAEGLAMGVPSIAADIPACREVGGDAARYYTSGSSESLARQIDELLRNQQLRASLSLEGRERGPLFTWRANAKGTLESLRRAIA